MSKLNFLFVKYPTLYKIVSNILWLGLDKLLRIGVGLLIMTWLARYLGPSNFGLLNFSSALVAIFGVLSAFGLNGIVVRDLVVTPENAKHTLGSAFFIKIIASCLSYFLLIATIIILRPQDKISFAIVAILGITLLFKTVSVINLWFESQVRYKHVLYAENTAFLIIAAVKLLMLFLDAPLISFVWAMLAESFLVAGSLIYVYTKLEFNPINWISTRERIGSLLKDSWPLIISSSAWILYTKIDQVMIGQLMGDASVGHYSAAVRIGETANLLPGIIAFSVIPAITKIRNKSSLLYIKQFQLTYNITIGSMIFVALLVTLLSKQIISLLFGSEYAAAADTLKIYIWMGVFVSMATVSGRFLINEGRQIATMWRHLLGVLLNIPLNFLMIPIWGIEGAAISSLIVMAITNYFYDAINPATRICFQQKTYALFGIYLISKNWISKK